MNVRTLLRDLFGPTAVPPPPPIPTTEAQLSAIDTLAEMEMTPQYELEATASRPTTPDTDTTSPQEAPDGSLHTHEENPMTTFSNRQIALQSAVENLSEDALYVDGEFDPLTVDAVLTVATRFLEFLDEDGESTGVPSGDSTSTTPAAPRQDAAARAVDEIQALLRRMRPDLGSSAVDAALERLPQLRETTRGGSRDSVISTAVDFVDSNGRSAFGSVVADRLIVSLRAL